MERSEFRKNLVNSFEVWKKGKATSADIDKLDKAIKFAWENGIDLVLKVPRSLIDKTCGARSMSKDDAMDFSRNLGGSLFIFDIPSENNRRSEWRNQLRLKAVAKYRDLGPCVLLQDRFIGTFGTFLPGEIASIEPR